MARSSAQPSASPRLVLAVLLLACILSFVDRYAMAVMVEPIKRDLGLSDGQIGVLTGLAFSLFYATCGLPLARFADRGFHKQVIVGSIVAWSALTAMMAAVQGFVQMALVRFGVGAGEAGVSPTSVAILADIFSPGQRSTVLAIFNSGGSIGLMLAFAAGAVLEQHFGWRTAFLILAAPGPLVALLAWRVVPSPRMRQPVEPRLTAAMRRLLGNPHMRLIPLAQGLTAFLLIGQAQWLPAFFERSFETDRATIGGALGLGQGISAIVGTLAGGVLADIARRRSVNGPIRLSIVAVLLCGLSTVFLYTAGTFAGALVAVVCMSFFSSVPAGAIFAHVQQVVARHDRATAAAMAIMMAALIGLGLGPVVVGLLSDALASDYGQRSLRVALLIAAPASAVVGAAILAWVDRLPFPEQDPGMEDGSEDRARTGGR